MAAKRKLSVEDYTVGWVCSSPIELAAATQMLDDRYDDLPLERNETNLYTLGRIRDHNVAITWLPAGEAGTHSAAAVTSQMVSKFTSVRFGLLVGIGSGAPSADSDIRLGDVVISQPHSTHGGVVQFDSGKIGSSDNGKPFMRTGFLNAPPVVLLSALTKFHAYRYRNESSISSHLSALKHLPGFDDTGPDILFKPGSRHIEGQLTCDKCKQEEREERSPRHENHEPSIHYGTIASGSSFVQDGRVRDQLSKELGGVLCFETEAAGLMNTFPCLVIRGICDYADSHSNTRWHTYAAAAAAACAKELLLKIPASEVSETRIVGVGSCPVLFLDIPDFTHHDEQYFVGREYVLEKLQARLQRTTNPEGNQHVRVALWGLGGVGKSQTAIKYAHLHRKKNPECSMFWISAANTDHFHQSFRRLAQKLGINDDEVEDVELSSRVRDMLVKDTMRQWLMIIDNADDVDFFYGYGNQFSSRGLVEYIPKCSHGTVLLTTRNKQLALDFGETVEVLAWTELESSEFVKKKLQLSDTESAEQDNAICKLANHLGHLPLALVQATSYMLYNSQTVKSYLNLYEKSEERMINLLSQQTHGVERASFRAVSTTWTISFDQINKKSPSATRLLSLMVFLDRHKIPRSLLQKEKDNLDSEDEEDESEDDNDQDEDADADLRFVADIGILRAYSLITAGNVDNMNNEEYNLHRLVQLVMRNSIKQRNLAGMYKALALKRLATSHPDPMDPEEWNKCQAYYPHALVVLQYKFELPKERKWKASLLSDVGMFLSERGQSREGERHVSKALEIREKEFGEEHEDTINCMAFLAIIYQRLGEWPKAQKFYLQVVQSLEKSAQFTLFDKLNATGNLANIYSKQGKLEDAEKLLIDVLDEINGMDNPESEYMENRLKSMMDLAFVYWEQGKWEQAQAFRERAAEESNKLGDQIPLKWTCKAELALSYLSGGDYVHAEKLQLAVVEMMEKIFSPDHPSVLNVKDQLASTYREQGKWGQAEDLQVSVITDFRRTLGQRHPSTLNALSNLAFTHDLQGRWKEAAKEGEEVVEGLGKSLGKNNSRTLTAMATLAHTYRNLGKLDKAEDLADKVMKTREVILRDSHPDLLKIMNNLASTYRVQGRLSEAEKLDEHVYKMRKNLFSDEHPLTLQSCRNLALTYWREGKLKAAEDLISMVLHSATESCSPDHPDTIAASNIMALIYQKQRKWNDAESLGSKVVEQSKSILGEQHPDTIARMGSLARTYRNMGKLKEAEELEDQVVQKLDSLIDGRHYLKLCAKYEQASTYLYQGKLEKAEKLELQVIDAMKQTLGEEHPDTLIALSGLVSTYQRQGRFKEAEELGAQVMNTMKKTLGEKHPDTLIAMSDLMLIYQQQKRWKDSKDIGEQVVEMSKMVLGSNHPDTLARESHLQLTNQQLKWWPMKFLGW